MKALKLFVAVMGISLLFASCKSNMDLTRRHYTKGYYFHKTKSLDQPKNTEALASGNKKEQVADLKKNEVELPKANPGFEPKSSITDNASMPGFSHKKQADKKSSHSVTSAKKSP